MQLFEQLTSYFATLPYLSSQQPTIPNFVFNTTLTTNHPSLLNLLPATHSDLPLVSINNHALSSLPAPFSPSSLLTPFHSLSHPNPSIASDLAVIRASSFISFDDASFLPLLSPTATLTTIHTFPAPSNTHVHEAPVYIPFTNELLFADTSLTGTLHLISLSSPYEVRNITTSPTLANVNGGTISCQSQNPINCTLYLTTNGGPNPSIYSTALTPQTFTSSTTNLGFEPLLTNYNTRPLNSPNDLITTPDSPGIIFTDPDYGFLQSWPGVKAPQLPNAIYYHNLTFGVTNILSAGQVLQPNGLALSPDGGKLYVAESGSFRGKPVHEDMQATRGVWVFDVLEPGNRVGSGRFGFLVESRWPDGLRVIKRGRGKGLLLIAVVGGVDVVDMARGVRVGRINLGGLDTEEGGEMGGEGGRGGDVVYNLEEIGNGDGKWVLTGGKGIYLVEGLG